MDTSGPSVGSNCEETKRRSGRKPRIWQAEAAKALTERERDVTCIAGTGSGKTLTFWMRLLLRSDGAQIVTTASNVLGEQSVVQLAEHIPSIGICGKQSFEVRRQTPLLQTHGCAGSY